MIDHAADAVDLTALRESLHWRIEHWRSRLRHPRRGDDPAALRDMIEGARAFLDDLDAAGSRVQLLNGPVRASVRMRTPSPTVHSRKAGA